MIDFSACANKLAAVAETRTAIMSIELSTIIASKYLELMRFAIPAHEALSDAALAKEYRVKSSQKAELAQSKIDECLQSGKIEDSNFEALTANCKYHHEQSQEHWAEENEALHLHAIHTLAYMRKLIEILPELDSMRVRIFLALRSDIGLSTMENDFKLSMQDQCERMVASLDGFIASLERKIQATSDTDA